MPMSFMGHQISYMYGGVWIKLKQAELANAISQESSVNLTNTGSSDEKNLDHSNKNESR